MKQKNLLNETFKKHLGYLKTKLQLNENTKPFNGKQVDLGSIEIDGIDREDYPDFTDAYITAADYTDGTPLSEDEIEQFSAENSSLASELVLDRELYR
jgi:hypothetical protein